MSQEASTKKWLPSQVYRDEAHAASVIAFLASHYRPDIDPRAAPYVLGIEMKATGELVGHVGLSPLHREVEVGFAVKESARGKGIAREAVRAMCSAFPSLPIIGVTALDNVPSQCVLLRAGFVREEDRRMPFQGGGQQTVLVFRRSAAGATS